MITAAADGSSLSNPGPAGWAWYIDDERWAAGGWPRGTNNMGELMAVLDLLQQTATIAAEPLHILCDSQYVINSVSKWMPGWKRKGWRKADGKPVLNVELLQEIDAALVGRKVTFEWVKGHAGHAMNEAADERARAAATAFRDGLPVDAGPGFTAESASPARETAFAPSVVEPELSLFDLEEPDPAQVDIDDVIAAEKALLANDVRTSTTKLEALLHPDFVEHGSSGRILTRGRALAGLEPLTLTPQVEILAAERLAPDLMALRWRLRLGSRVSLRFSLWQRVGAAWQIRFHQGTASE